MLADSVRNALMTALGAPASRGKSSDIGGSVLPGDDGARVGARTSSVRRNELWPRPREIVAATVLADRVRFSRGTRDLDLLPISRAAM